MSENREPEQQRALERTLGFDVEDEDVEDEVLPENTYESTDRNAWAILSQGGDVELMPTPLESEAT